MTSPHPRGSARLPSALAEFRPIAEVIGNRPAAFFDYDGTLTEIVEDPANARLSDANKSSLVRLSGCCPVGIISGRELTDIRELVGISGIMYVGSHGLEIASWDGDIFEPESVQEAAETLEQAEAELTAAVENLPGIYLERKRLSVAVHTRRAHSESGRRRARRAAADAVERSDGELILQEGKEVAELRSAVDWDKGSAISYLVEQLPATRGVEVIYLGDDRTDEAAFRWVRSVGGVAILVGDSPRTAAAYQLDGPPAVAHFLTKLVDHVC